MYIHNIIVGVCMGSHGECIEMVVYMYVHIYIRAQISLSPSLKIETNRNTALTLACFQGRHEVVSLLVERQANVEHRAKVSAYSNSQLNSVNCTRK